MDNRKRRKYDFDHDGDMSMDNASNSNQISSVDSLPFQIAQLHLDDDYKKKQMSKEFYYNNYNKRKENAPPLHFLPFHPHQQQKQDQNKNQNQQNTDQKVNKWWIPENDEQLRLFKEAKLDVLCFLSVNKEGIKVGEAFEIMSKQTQAEIDFVTIGFYSFSELLFHFDDILMVKTNGKDDFIFLKKGVEAPELSHIRNLVQKTPSGRSNYREFKATILNTVSAPLENLLKTNNMKTPLVSKQISHGQKRKRSSRGVFN